MELLEQDPIMFNNMRHLSVYLIPFKPKHILKTATRQFEKLPHEIVEGFTTSNHSFFLASSRIVARRDRLSVFIDDAKNDKWLTKLMVPNRAHERHILPLNDFLYLTYAFGLLCMFVLVYLVFGCLHHTLFFIQVFFFHFHLNSYR